MNPLIFTKNKPQNWQGILLKNKPMEINVSCLTKMPQQHFPWLKESSLHHLKKSIKNFPQNMTKSGD